MTDNEIIKALECCFLSECACKDCPYSAFEVCETTKMINTVIDLINRQKAEIERLENYNNNLVVANTHISNNLLDEIDKAKVEAVKEFAEMLKENVKNQNSMDFEDIDNLVKEMTER